MGMGHCEKAFPKATFTKNLYSSANNDCTLPYMIDPAGYSFVSVTVDIDGESQTEVLPVLNHANKAVSQPDSFRSILRFSAVWLSAVQCTDLGITSMLVKTCQRV